MDLETAIETPLSDKFITEYMKQFGDDVKIITYDNLDEYRSIDELLPNEKDYFMLLYLSEPNSGHWICVCKLNNEIIFFDPYGIYVDDELKWTSYAQRKKLDVDKPYLSELLNKTDLKVVYNKFRYQLMKKDVNTCGRHCCFFLGNMRVNNFGLKKYYKLMQKLKKKMKMNYDEIVATFVKL